MSRDPVLRRAAISWARQGELTPQRLWPVLRALGGVEALLATSEEELTKRLESGTRALAVLRSAEDVSSEKWVMQLERTGPTVYRPARKSQNRLTTSIRRLLVIMALNHNIRRDRAGRRRSP